MKKSLCEIENEIVNEITDAPLLSGSPRSPLRGGRGIKGEVDPGSSSPGAEGSRDFRPLGMGGRDLRPQRPLGRPSGHEGTTLPTPANYFVSQSFCLSASASPLTSTFQTPLFQNFQPPYPVVLQLPSRCVKARQASQKTAPSSLDVKVPKSLLETSRSEPRSIPGSAVVSQRRS